MKKIITASLVAALAVTSVQAESTSQRLADIEAQLAKVKKKLKKQNKKINAVKAHDSGDNIKWSADVRTAIDSISYDMASGEKYEKNDLMSLRLWLNMAYAPDQNNVFKGQLSMNKAFGADFGTRGWGMDNFDWLTNEALTNGNLRVRQAYWLYLGENAFGADIPWTFSLGRRPSTNGFLANLRDDDAAQSPLGHIINVEFDGLSSKLDLSKVTGVPGMSFKVCMGQGSTNASPRLAGAVDYADTSDIGMTFLSTATDSVEDITLAGFILEPYNDGQFVTKATWFKANDLPDMVNPMQPELGLQNVGDITGGAFSVLVDGLTEDGFLADTKVFASIAYSKTDPYAGSSMLGSAESETGTSYWVGAQLPVMENGKLGLEYNHGSQYWRPFTYAEDTMAGSKLAVRGDAYEAYFTYQLTEALSAQVRYTRMNYDYSGSNGFFGSTTGMSMDIDTIKENAALSMPGLPADLSDPSSWTPAEAQAVQAVGMAANTVETAEDFRFYIRYRF